MDVSADEKARIKDKIDKLKNSKFKQQTLPAWRPVPTAMSTMLTFSFFSVVFLVMGVVLYIMSDQIVELERQYNESCYDDLRKIDPDTKERVPCEIPFNTVENEIEGPIYVYYQLDNFYQNHRRYVKSRDNNQLAGEYLTVEELSDCNPIQNVSDLWTNQQKNLNGKDLDGDLPAIPCGLVAKSIFNDTYELYREVEGGSDEKIDISSDNIAWTSDITYKFKNILKVPEGKGTDFMDVQWMNMTDQHFIVWMRTAGLPNFRKLWGRINTNLKPGKYYLKVYNEYDVQPFKGAKSFVISTTNAVGGKNYFLAVCYIVVGTLCMLFAFVFCAGYLKRKNNPTG